MRICLASVYAEGLWLAWKMAHEGHDVSAVVAEERYAEALKGLVRVMPGGEVYESSKYDLVVLDTSGMGEVGDQARTETPTIGGSTLADKLEEDRLGALEFMARCGLQVAPWEAFDNPADAIRFIKKRNVRMVFKPIGEQSDKSTTYVSRSPEDMLDYFDVLFRTAKVKEFILQEYVEGTEISLEAYINETGYYALNATLETKKLMNGDLGPNTGCSGSLCWMIERENALFQKGLKKCIEPLQEMGYVGPLDLNTIVNASGVHALEFCYSEDTEVLTKIGWKPMKDVVVGEFVASLTDDKELVYVPVEETTRLRWNKDIIHFHSNDCYDLMVTPNHSMVFQDDSGKILHKYAKDTPKGGARTVRTAHWTGLDVEQYTIPAYTEKHSLGKYRKVIDLEHPEIRVPMEAWCRFLGLFVAEGHLGYVGHDVPYTANITQHVKIQECREVIEACGFKAKHNGHRFGINSTQIARHLETLFGTARCWDKRIPRFVLELAPKYVEAFLDGFRIGDGNIHKRGGQRTLHTSSKGLADDLAEAILRIGFWSRITTTEPNGKSFAKRTMYHVNERRVKCDGRIFPRRHLRYVPYDGHVVCITVPNHRLYVRRPGGPAMWCANTPRFGYDATALLTRLLPISFGDFLHAIASGTRVPDLTPKHSFCASARLSIPPYPCDGLPDKFYKAGVPIQGLTEKNLDKFFVYDVRKRDEEADDLETAGLCGWVGSPLSVGETIGSAFDGAYEMLKHVRVPNGMYRTDVVNNTAKRYAMLREAGVLQGV